MNACSDGAQLQREENEWFVISIVPFFPQAEDLFLVRFTIDF
jgi:hypothetical protein